MMTTNLFRGLVLGSMAVGLLTGCPKKDGDAADAAAEAAEAPVVVADAAPPPAALPAAENENAVSRFADEKKLENVTATIQRPTNVRELPSIGKVVASLAKGGTVTEIASRGTFFLVVFTNPADQKTLMGWVSEDSFNAAPPAPIVALKCAGGETPLISDAPFCGKICTADTDCPGGQACKGAANKLVGAAGKGSAVTVCTVFGAPRPVAPAVVTPTPAAPLAPPGTVGVTAAVAGKCPVGFSIVRDGQCHRVCGTCPASAPFCIACGGPTVCSANKDLCK